MAKDAKGHGSEKRGGASADDLVKLAYSTAHHFGPDAKGVGLALQSAAAQSAKEMGVTPISNGKGGAAHQAGVNMVGGQKQITIFHQDGEYAVPIPGNKGHSFTDDKVDAENTARTMHGQNIVIKHRAKSWGPEMD